MLVVRPERTEDAGAIAALHEAAFPGGLEAQLVERLRSDGDLALSLVAESPDGVVIGHIALSLARLGAGGPALCWALGPMAVLPEHQRRGVGSELVRAFIAHALARGVALVFVLGHPRYYPRFGFVPARAHGLTSKWDEPPLDGDPWMVLALSPAALPPEGAPPTTVRYAAAFEALF